MSDISVLKSVLVEVYVPTSVQGTTQTINVSNQQQLQGAFIHYIRAYCVDDMPVSPTGKALVSADTMRKSYLTLNIQDLDYVWEKTGPLPGQEKIQRKAADPNFPPMGEFIKQMPLIDLHVVNTSNGSYNHNELYLNQAMISWDKCYINTGVSMPQGNVSYVFNVLYSYEVHR